jgi:hypothetical protein
MTMNRRCALTTVGALFGAMATAGADAPTRQPKPGLTAGADDGMDELRRWEEETYGKPDSVKRRRLDEAQAALLPAYREVEAAMNAVLDADYEVADDSYWLEDVDGVRYFADSFAVVLEGDAHGAVLDAARAELARRIEAHERGVYYHCPVYWGWCAIKRAREAARAEIDRDYGPGEEPCILWDVRYQAWAAEMWEGVYDNENHLHMNDAAGRAWMDGLYARIAEDRAGHAAAAR